MDIESFGHRLELALAWKLRTHAADFATSTMRAFDLGVFPWHGYLEPSFLTTADTCPERQIGDWKLYNFTKNHDWPEVRDLEVWMRLSYERAGQANAELFFMTAGRALRSRNVQQALAMFNLAPSFYVSVFNPDDLRSKNYCSE